MLSKPLKSIISSSSPQKKIFKKLQSNQQATPQVSLKQFYLGTNLICCMWHSSKDCWVPSGAMKPCYSQATAGLQLDVSAGELAGSWRIGSGCPGPRGGHLQAEVAQGTKHLQHFWALLLSHQFGLAAFLLWQALRGSVICNCLCHFSKRVGAHPPTEARQPLCATFLLDALPSQKENWGPRDEVGTSLWHVPELSGQLSHQITEFCYLHFCSLIFVCCHFILRLTMQGDNWS